MRYVMKRQHCFPEPTVQDHQESEGVCLPVKNIVLVSSLRYTSNPFAIASERLPVLLVRCVTVSSNPNCARISA